MPAKKYDVLQRREQRVEGELLRHVSHFPPGRGRVFPDVEALDAHRAGGDLQQPGDHLDGRGLAGAVGAEKTHDLPAGHVEGDALDGLEAAEVLAQVADLDGRRGAAHACLS